LRLEEPALRQLKQRIVLRCRLEPFSADDTERYIEARFEKAGMPNQSAFSPEITGEIYVRSQGIPRLINSISDNLLLTCFAMSSKVATRGMLDEVCRDLRLESVDNRPLHATAHPAY
ncbi:MAG TPA: hypothetical protein VKG79_02230, partial [Bryobacteraceae bacterium]|nr:hypothetical protein [Bryobacteraceae bacterium]